MIARVLFLTFTIVFAFLSFAVVEGYLPLEEQNVVLVARTSSVIFTICVAIMLYAVRENFRVLYGIVEIVFGISVSTYVWFSVSDEVVLIRPYETPLDDYPSGLSAAMVAAFGAVYIIVRGIDNVGTGLKKHPRFDAMWGNVFYLLRDKLG